MQVRQQAVRVQGAELYYELRGQGPPVLIIQGGVSEAGATQQLAEALIPHYQVISFDRRGLSRSTASIPPTTLATHADDAATLLSTVSAQPARVIGPSIGALIGLHLAVRHPERVATLVAHEPPMSALVCDPQQEAGLDEVAVLAQTDVQAAIRHFVSLSGNEEGAHEEEAHPASPVGDVDANLRHFFAYDFPGVRNCTLNVGQIAAAPPTIIPTGGAESRGRWEYRCAEQLAHELDRKLIETPGGHNGLISHPWATAAVLTRLFTKAEYET